MKKSWTYRILVALFIVAMLLQTAAVSLPASPSTFASSSTTPLIRLTISNKTGETLFIYLKGPAQYILPVPWYLGQKAIFTVKKGLYDYSFQACGQTVTGRIDITKQQLLVVPVCRLNPPSAKLPNGVRANVSPETKLMSVSLYNHTTGVIEVILDGPAHYIFWLRAGEITYYTLEKGAYVVTYYACGFSDVVDFTARANARLKLNCPDP
jgi:hypothetical protein